MLDEVYFMSFLVNISLVSKLCVPSAERHPFHVTVSCIFVQKSVDVSISR